MNEPQVPESKNPIDTVSDFLIEGHANIDILEYLEKNGFTPDAAKAVLQEALYKFVKVANVPPEVRRGWCIEVQRHLYQKMEDSGDYAGARQAVQEIARLADVYPKKGGAKRDVDDVKDEIDSYLDDMLTL